MELNDGTIIPSYMGVSDTATSPEPSEMFGNTSLRIGEVKEIIYPSSKKSVSKKFIEYRVAVQHRDNQGISGSTEYGNCYLANMFGGIADKVRFTYRKEAEGSGSVDGLGQGSKVLLLCVNGESSNAVIVGGLRDGRETTKDPEDTGHHLLFEFNGTKATINSDGEFKLEFKGATKADGSLADGVDAGNSGAAMTFKKNGDIFMEHGAQTILLDHTGKSWKLEADQNINQSAGGTWTSEASQTANLNGTTGVNIGTSATCKISAANTKIGGDLAIDALVKGTTYRLAETTMNATIVGGLTTAIGALGGLAGLIATAGAGVTAAAAAHVVPIAGPIVGAIPLAASGAALAACSGLLATVIAGLTTCVTAISTFEGGALAYLSQKNTTD